MERLQEATLALQSLLATRQSSPIDVINTPCETLDRLLNRLSEVHPGENYSEFLATELKDIRRHVADILLLRDGFDIKQKKAKQTIPEEAEGRQLSTRAHRQ